MAHEPVWLRTDEKLEAINSLLEIRDQLKKLRRTGSFHSWKWIIFALHNSLQGFMVWALRHGNDRDVIKDKIDKKSGKKYLQIYYEQINDKSIELPNDLLATFLDLYKKVKSISLMESRWSGGRRFIPEGTQGRSVKSLNYWRNRFTHFFPTGLSIEISGFPCLALDCIEIIRFLAFESGHICFENEDQEAQVNIALDEISEKFTSLCV